MRSKLWITVFLLCCCTTLGQTTDSGVDIYIAACLNHGRNFSIFNSGIGEFEVIEFSKDSGQTKKQFSAKVIFKGNDPGKGKRLFYKKDAAGKEVFTYLIDGKINRGEITTVYSYDVKAPTLYYVISRTQFAIPEFMKFGRIQGNDAWATIIGILDYSNKDVFLFDEKKVSQFKNTLASVSKQFNTKPFGIDREEKYDAGKGTATVLVSKDDTGHIASEYWIDINRGYICPLVRLYDDESGKLIKEYKSSDFFCEKNTSHWFPQNYEEKTFDNTSGELLESVSYHLKKDSFQMNIDIDDSLFTIEIPKGTYVLDDRDDVTKKYVAEQKGQLSLNSKGINLETMNWLKREPQE